MQDALFSKIQQGVYDFPENEWSCVSESAKDLIRHLLVRNPVSRFTAAQVLEHPWVTNPGTTDMPLTTPNVLKRYANV